MHTVQNISGTCTISSLILSRTSENCAILFFRSYCEVVMTAFVLKLIACLTMLIDHVGYIFFPRTYLLRFIGRIAFPIYCFQIVQGYRHTSNFRGYLGRVALFSLISEVCYDLAFHNTWFDPTDQNVYFTLFLGLLCIWCTDHMHTYLADHDRALHADLLALLVIAMFCMAARFMQTDYDAVGILYIMAFYYADRMRPAHPACASAFLCVVFALIFLAMPIKLHGALPLPDYIGSMQRVYWVYSGTFLSLILVHFANGKYGFHSKLLKLAFYLFYPGHLMALYLIHRAVMLP